MSRTAWTRRAVLPVIAAAAVLAAGAGLAQTNAPEGVRFKAIKVDFAPLRENGAGVFAEWLGQMLPAALNSAFAARLAPGDRNAATLIVRVDLATLGPPGMLTGMGGVPRLHDTMDDIEGSASVIDAGGRTLSTTPLRSTVLADSNSPSLTVEELNRNRVVMLGRVFAHELPGQMGL